MVNSKNRAFMAGGAEGAEAFQRQLKKELGAAKDKYDDRSGR